MSHLYGYIEGRWPDATVNEVGARTLSVEGEIDIDADDLPGHIEIRRAMACKVWLRLDTDPEVEELIEKVEDYLEAAHGYGRPDADAIIGDLDAAIEAAEQDRLDDFLPGRPAHQGGER